VDLRTVITKPYFVFRSQKVPDVLNELRAQHIHLAVVSDDYGGTMGIITMEDLLEELVGEIYDEDEETESDFSKIRDGVFSVSGDYNIYEALEDIGYKEKNFESDYSSVGGWVFEILQKIPTVGESFSYNGINVKVTEMDEQRVTRAIIEYSPKENAN
ncbi:MAG: transporter associated domain-containing protein, partial [Oscillospiraceae bacterium]